MTLIISSTTPTNGAIQVALSSAITIVIQSSNTAIPATIEVIVAGAAAISGGLFQAGFTGTIIPGTPSATITIVIHRSTSFNSFDVIPVSIQVSDAANTITYNFSFTTLDVIAPVFIDITPADLTVDNSTNTPIFFRVQDQGSGIARTTTATLVSGNATLTNVEIVAGLTAGMTVRGTGIPPNTTIFSVSPPHTLVLSQNATTSIVGGNVTFFNVNVTVNAANAILGGVIQPGFSGTVTTIGSSIDVYLTRATQYAFGSTVSVTASATDEDNTTSQAWQFAIVDLQLPTITNQTPSPDATNISETTSVTMAFSHSTGILNSTINIQINGIGVVINGVPQVTYGTINFVTTPSSTIVVIQPNIPFASSQTVRVFASVENARDDKGTSSYTFHIRDFQAPTIENRRPAPNAIDILPSTDVEFVIAKDPDGYDVDFSTLSIHIDGYDAYAGVFDGYLISEGYGVFTQPTVEDAYGNVLFQGFTTTITPLTPHKYDVVIHPLLKFDFEALVFVQVQVADFLSHATNVTYSFDTAPANELVTIATPSTGTFKNYIDGYGLQFGFEFLTQIGITLTPNLHVVVDGYTVTSTITGGPPAGTPAFGTARDYAVLAASTVTNTGSSVLTGNLGLHPGTSVTGFPPGTVSGTQDIANAAALTAKTSAQATYSDLQARPSGTSINILDGLILGPGTYTAATSAALATSGSATLTLNGAGVYVFQIGSTLKTGAGGVPTIALANGALASNIYWIVGSSATLNIGSPGTFQGNVIAQASITVTSGGTVNGTLAALTAAVTLSAATAINAQPLTPTTTTTTTTVPGTDFSIQDGYAITYYTLDGSMPQANRYGQVMGSTKVYTTPIRLQREGLNVLKFRSADEAGNLEDVKQEVYMLSILPPDIEEIKSVRIIRDISLATTVIPLEVVQDVAPNRVGVYALLFTVGASVRVLDDVRPPITTTVLAVNATSNPPFIIVSDPVQKLRVSKNARVEILPLPINPSTTIDFDTRALPEFMYIGSDGEGLNQADAVFEKFRVLNVASTDAEILADFTLLQKGTPFFNQTNPVQLPATISALEAQRSNMPDNTLILLDFDGTITNSPRQGVLSNNTLPIVDIRRAGNRVDFTISVPANTFIDRQLLETVLKNFAPADLDVHVAYVEVD